MINVTLGKKFGIDPKDMKFILKHFPTSKWHKLNTPGAIFNHIKTIKPDARAKLLQILKKTILDQSKKKALWKGKQKQIYVWLNAVKKNQFKNIKNKIEEAKKDLDDDSQQFLTVLESFFAKIIKKKKGVMRESDIGSMINTLVSNIKKMKPEQKKQKKPKNVKCIEDIILRF